MLTVLNVSTGYQKKEVLSGISFNINRGEIVMLAGSNGSGKSTLLKTIFGMLPLWSEGKITFNGEIITGSSASELLKKGLLYIPQKNNLFEDLTVRENLQMAGLTLGKKIAKERIAKTLASFDVLGKLLNRTPMRLSGGERQLLVLAMATLHQPAMILYDEPFGGLSAHNITFISHQLKMLGREKGITLLIVEHRVRECTAIADRVIGLKLGRMFSDVAIKKGFDINSLQPIFL
ncbi:hypothetical protein A4D02_16450 [Niastella koreensis]|nr:ATP-binding cassette domain-containing protein [Niastella koreensis]OQP40499.1 hypothetical protein A4D02_16450 [Niastella koreensis]